MKTFLPATLLFLLFAFPDNPIFAYRKLPCKKGTNPGAKMRGMISQGRLQSTLKKNKYAVISNLKEGIMIYNFYSIIPAILLCLVLSVLGSAQSIWLNGNDANSINLEVVKPSIERENDITFSSSVWFVSGKFAVSSGVNILAEIPLVYFNESSEEGSQFVFGNPYLGIALFSGSSPFSTQFGVRLPFAPDSDAENGEALFYGLFTEFIDRPEAFLSNAVPVSARFQYSQVRLTGLAFHLRVEPAWWIATGERDDSELVSHYSAQIGYQSARTAIMGGISGLWWISGDENAEKNWHQLGVSASLTTGRVRPGISLRIPLDESINNIVDLTVGLNTSIQL